MTIADNVVAMQAQLATLTADVEFIKTHPAVATIDPTALAPVLDAVAAVKADLEVTPAPVPTPAV